MAIHKTEGIVLKTQKLRSSSLIVTFFTSHFGKLKGVAKGVRKEREVRGAYYELFTHLEIIFYEKTRSDLHLISEAAIIESHDNIRTRLDTISYASYFSELVDVICQVHDPHESIFELLEFAFRFLPSVRGEKMARLFEIKLLNDAGLIPFLDQCIECHQAVLENAVFSISHGGLLCRSCAGPAGDVREISREALNVLRYFAKHSLDECLKCPMSLPVEEELKNHMERFLLFRLGDPLKTRRFISEIQPML